MCDQQIRRRLTADDMQEADSELSRYDALYAQFEEEDREEHDREFGPSIPFKGHSASLHARVEAKLKKEREYDAWDRVFG